MDWISLASCLLAFLLYYNTLDAGFVYDDRRAILSNPDLLPSTPWKSLLENDFWGTPLTDSGSHGSYRPLCVFTFRLNYLLGGFQPWGYHLVNVLLHCLATALVVRVARAILPSAKTKIGTAIAGLTFASHPIHTEAVAGVVGRADLAACNFYLLSFLVYVAHVKYRDFLIDNELNNDPLPNGCCVKKCLKINGVSQVKKTLKKPVRHTVNGTANGHIVTNGYVTENNILSNNSSSSNKGSFLYNAERLKYHNVLLYLIDSIRHCNWIGKVEELSASGAIICALKFFLSCGRNTWQVKRKRLTKININNNTINGDVKRGCGSSTRIESVNGNCKGVLSNGILNGSANHSNGVYHHHNGSINESVKCHNNNIGNGKFDEGKDSIIGRLCHKCNNNNSVNSVKCSGSWGWRCHGTLLCCILLAAAATLSKETGITALAACALYDVLRAAQDATWNNKRRIFSLGMLFAALIALLAARVPLSSTPKFARADNPTAKEPSIVTRLLTFYYLPVFNFFLLVCPTTLSFDWSMDAIPRINSIFDLRNILSCTFYYFLSKILWKACSSLHKQGENVNNKQQNISIRKDNKILRNFGYLKNGTNGNRCLKVNRNGLVYQYNSLCNYNNHSNSNGIIKNNRVLVSSNGRKNENGKTLCHCPCCRHALTDHHSNSCRAINNNNSMTHNSCTCTVMAVAIRSVEKQHHQVSSVNKNSQSALLLAISFLTLPFLPATNLFFYVGFVVAERVLYLPSVGFCLLLGIGGAKVSAKLSSRARAAALGALLLALSARTVVRNRDWKDEESLYRSAVKVNPPKAFGNLGSVLSGLGRTREAEMAFHEALRYRPNMADVHYNLGVLLQGKGQYEKAIQSFERAIHFRPSLALAYVNMGASLSAVGRCSEAASVLTRASRLDGNGLRDPKEHATAKTAALQHLGTLYAAQGKLKKALQVYKEALAMKPPYYRSQKLYALMSEALFRLQRWQDADNYRKAAIYSTEEGTRPISWKNSDSARKVLNRYKRILLSTSRSYWMSVVQKHKKHIYGAVLRSTAAQVTAVRNKEIRLHKARVFASILNEPGMIVANCRLKEQSTKSCCN